MLACAAFLAAVADSLPVGLSVRYWLPVRLLLLDTPHRITGRAVIAIMSASHDYVAGEYRRKPPVHSSRDVLLIVGGLVALVAIAAEVRWALGAR